MGAELVRRRLVIVLAVILAACGGSTPTQSPGVASSTAASSTTAQPGGSAVAELPPFGDMPFYRDDIPGRLVEPGPGPLGAPQLAWQTDIGATHWAPILAGGLIVVATSTGAVVALDGRTGDRRWAFQAEHGFTTGSFNGSAAAADGLVFISDTSTTYALDAASGALRWTAPASTLGSRPLVVDGVVYVGTVGGAVGLAETTGSIVWRWTGPQNVAVTVGPIVDGVAYLSSRSDGRLYAIGVPDGTERWHLPTIALAVGSSEVVGDTVFVGTNQAGANEPVGQVYAIDRATGRARWQFGGPHGGQLVPGPVRDGILYVSGETDGIYALREDGSVAWGPVAAPPSVLPLSMVGDTLYEQRRDGSIGAYQAADGTLIWETPATGDDGGGPPLVDGGMVFEVGDSSGVRAYADPSLIAELPVRAAAPSASPSPSAPRLPDPFAVVRSFSWTSTKLAIPQGMDIGPDGNLYILDTKPSVTVIDPKDGHTVLSWGRQGTGPGEFDLTRQDDNSGNGDIAVAPNGHVYVADGTNARVEEFLPDGTFVTQFGGYGTGDGQFGITSEIVIGPDGGIYVLDQNANRISKFSAAGKFLWRSPTPEADPDLANYLHGMAVRADGTLLLTCEQCDHFLVLDPKDGHVRDRLAAPIGGDRSGPTNLDPAGNIYVAVYGSDSELVFDPAGKLLAGLEHQAAAPATNIGNGHVEWGDTFWPSPVFAADGHGYTFWKDGLIELSVKLPG